MQIHTKTILRNFALLAAFVGAGAAIRDGAARGYDAGVTDHGCRHIDPTPVERARHAEINRQYVIAVLEILPGLAVAAAAIGIAAGAGRNGPQPS